MPPTKSITEWTEQVSEHFPKLSRPQASVLALWSYAALALQCCGQSQVVSFLAGLLKAKDDTIRQRLREWTWEIGAKTGQKRQEVVVATCFAPLLSWILSGLASDERRLAVALDATTLKQNVVVLSISVLYCGCAIPVAWQVLPATAPGAWRPHWLALLKQLRQQVPADWQVLVLADRGLFADWLFEAIQALHWHPFLRINTGGMCRVWGTSEFRPLLSLLPAADQTWSGRVVCFKTTCLAATLLIHHDQHHDHPWLILTDLPPQVAPIAWYSLRAWIEAQFKDIKSGGWQWQRTRMTDPERVSRLWLVMAVALLYSVSLGSQVEAQQPASMLAALPPTHVARRTATGRPKPRRLSLTLKGQLDFLVQLIRGDALPAVHFRLPNLWPSHL
jgi:Transposase DDE domain